MAEQPAGRDPVGWGDWGSEVRDDPFPHFAEARRRCAVQRARLVDGHDAYVVLGHTASRQALAHRGISKDMAAALEADPEVAAAGLPGPAFSRHMLNVDPPDHRRLRALVARAFTPARVMALEPAIRAIATDLLDALAEAAHSPVPVDLCAGYAAPLPFQVIGELLGIPVEDRPRLHDWFATLLGGWDGEPPPATVAASDGIVGYLAELVDAKRHTPAADLVSVLVEAGDGDRLTRQEVLSSLFQLVVAGHDTTTSLIGNGIVTLLDHPGQLDWLLEDLPRRLPGAVEELVRFTAPVPHATFRMTTEDTDLDGTTVPGRQQVLVCLASANRDPAAFERAETLDLSRRPGTHVGFGHGIHYCLGAPLARLEARVAFEVLLGRFPGLGLAVDRSDLAWTHGDGLVLRGLGSLPVHLGPASDSQAHDHTHTIRTRNTHTRNIHTGTGGTP